MAARPRVTTISAAACCWAARRCTSRSPCRKAACGSIWAAGRGRTWSRSAPNCTRRGRSTWSISATRCWRSRGSAAQARGWKNVEAIAADATTFQPAAGPADVVTFSYSLTMIPDWYAAIDNALTMLRPGGTIGVTDFFVARKYPAEGRTRHGWFTRTFWPAWFGSDNVFLSPDHLPYLQRKFSTDALGREAGEGALPSADPRAVLYVYWPEGRMRFIGKMECSCQSDRRVLGFSNGKGL